MKGGVVALITTLVVACLKWQASLAFLHPAVHAPTLVTPSPVNTGVMAAAAHEPVGPPLITVGNSRDLAFPSLSGDALSSTLSRLRIKQEVTGTPVVREMFLWHGLSREYYASKLWSIPGNVRYYPPINKGSSLKSALHKVVQGRNMSEVAITDRSYFIIRQEGWRDSWSYTKYSYVYKNVPEGLHTLMSSLPSSEWFRAPLHVALGPQNQYVVLFPGGGFQMQGPRELHDSLRRCGWMACQVAVGSWGSWCIMLRNGTIVASEVLPHGLRELLESRAMEGVGQQHTPRPMMITLGPMGEWFVMYDDGYWYACGDDKVMESIKRCKERGQRVKNIQFGEGGVHAIAFDSARDRPSWMTSSWDWMGPDSKENSGYRDPCGGKNPLYHYPKSLYFQYLGE